MGCQFKKTDLFGGAISVNVPSDFADVSQIRQVPDNQEVYLSSTGFSSLIFDLGERVTQTETDEGALRYHFEDIVDEKDTYEIWSITTDGIRLPHLSPNTPIFSLLATTKPPSTTTSTTSSVPRRPNTATSVTILMGLIRLVNENTDIAVTLSIPSMKEGEGSDAENEVSRGSDGELRLGQSLQVGQTILDEVWKTFEIKDWSLFVEG